MIDLENNVETESKVEFKQNKLFHRVLSFIFTCTLFFYKPFVVCYIYNLILAPETGYIATYSVVFALFIIKMFLMPFDYNNKSKPVSEELLDDIRNRNGSKLMMIIALSIIHITYYLIY